LRSLARRILLLLSMEVMAAEAAASTEAEADTSAVVVAERDPRAVTAGAVLRPTAALLRIAGERRLVDPAAIPLVVLAV
jgi:hypothetical protein